MNWSDIEEGDSIIAEHHTTDGMLIGTAIRNSYGDLLVGGLVVNPGYYTALNYDLIDIVKPEPPLPDTPGVVVQVKQPLNDVQTETFTFRNNSIVNRWVLVYDERTDSRPYRLPVKVWHNIDTGRTRSSLPAGVVTVLYNPGATGE